MKQKQKTKNSSEANCESLAKYSTISPKKVLKKVRGSKSRSGNWFCRTPTDHIVASIMRHHKKRLVGKKGHYSPLDILNHYYQILKKFIETNKEFISSRWLSKDEWDRSLKRLFKGGFFQYEDSRQLVLVLADDRPSLDEGF